MAHDGDGKGPGFAMMWAVVAVLFIAGPTIAAALGYAPWWGALGWDAIVGGVYARLMLTAVWA